MSPKMPKTIRYGGSSRRFLETPKSGRTLARRPRCVSSAFRFHMLHNARQDIFHHAADLAIGLEHVVGVEIGTDTPEHRVRPRLINISHDEVVGICGGLRVGKIELLRGPLPNHPIAACAGPEFQFFVVCELCLEAFLYVLESRHGDSSRRMLI